MTEHVGQAGDDQGQLFERLKAGPQVRGALDELQFVLDSGCQKPLGDLTDGQAEVLRDGGQVVRRGEDGVDQRLLVDVRREGASVGVVLGVGGRAGVRMVCDGVGGVWCCDHARA
ncbi:MAG: hypothetical protein Kow0022_03520 [Phycisphaerales bacterium]